MQSLTDLLLHPYLVLNHVAEAVYGEENIAVKTRLRSRVNGRHRFTREEYKAIRSKGLSFARRLDGLADRIGAWAVESPPSSRGLQLIHHPWLKKKNILRAAAATVDLTYLQVYDGLRGKRQLPRDFYLALAGEYQDFATFVRQQLEIATEEKKNYPFRAGMGGKAHLPKEEKDKK